MWRGSEKFFEDLEIVIEANRWNDDMDAFESNFEVFFHRIQYKYTYLLQIHNNTLVCLNP